MLKGKEYQEYTIVTSRKLYDYFNVSEEEEEIFREQLYEDQMDFVENEIKTRNVIIHFIEDTAFLNEHYEYTCKKEIDEYIERLAIKDGIDLVRFSNGNIGYIAYYSGCENGFEIIQTEMTEEEFEEMEQEMEWR